MLTDSVTRVDEIRIAPLSHIPSAVLSRKGESDFAMEDWYKPMGGKPDTKVFKEMKWDDEERYKLVTPGGFDSIGMNNGGVAYDRELDRLIFVKMSKANLCQESPDIPQNSFSYLVYNEGLILAGLDHPNIIKVHDYTVVKIGKLYVPCIALEKLEGENMARIKLNRVRSGLNEVAPDMLDYLDDIADAVDYLHFKGVIHADVKPENFFVDIKFGKDKRIAQKRGVLYDFGLARRKGKDERLSEIYKDCLLVTPGYASPRVMMGNIPTEADDRWAFAASVFTLLTDGDIPYGEEVDEGSVDAAMRVLEPANLRKIVDMKKMADVYGIDKCKVLDALFDRLLNDIEVKDNSEFNSCKKIVEEVRRILGLKVDEERKFNLPTEKLNDKN